LAEKKLGHFGRKTKDVKMFATVHTWSLVPYKVLWKQSCVWRWTVR